MKVIVSESLRYNANYIIPPERNSCCGLLENFFLEDLSDTDFGKKCNFRDFERKMYLYAKFQLLKFITPEILILPAYSAPTMRVT